MNIVVARYLGASDSGFLFLSITITTLMATISRIGADNTVLRFVSVHSAKQEWGVVRAIVANINKFVWLITAVLSIVLCLLVKPISIYLFKKPDLQWPLFWAIISMPFFAVSNILAMALQGRKKVIFSVTTLKITSPVVLIIFMFSLSPKNVTDATIYYTISNIIALVLAYYWWFKSVPPGTGTFEMSKFWKSCIPLWISAIMQQLIVWGGQFVAGIYNSPAELAQLAVARNTAVLITFILTAINFVSSPRFASLYSEGKMEELKKYARNTTWLMTMVATPLLLVIWIFPEAIMSLFGKDFHDGVWLLRILALGQYISVITGSVGYLLIMSGHEADMMMIRIVNGIGAIILAFILNPIFGAIGSAAATAVAVAGSNLMALGLVKKRLGFNTMASLGFLGKKDNGKGA